jgi:branched-chain amino acid transport system permease protein
VIGNVVGVLFDGLAYGSLLFIIAVGLSVTLGLMNFVNLAHGAFAMVGGYVCVLLMTRLGVPFLLTLPAAFVASAVVGVILERTLYQRLYKSSHLDQVLFSIGLVFVSIAIATYFFGASQQPVSLPPYLRGQVHFFGLDFGVYRIFLIVVVAALTVALQYVIEKTRFGSQVRASVDNATAAAGLGIDVLGLDPTFPLKYMVYFLLVVSVGGTGTIKGPLVAALILGVFDVAGKYYLPEIGGFVIYALMVILLILFPAGLYGRRT